MTEPCTQTPVSWLDLELYALGELAPAQHTEVEAHLTECTACHACAEHIEDSRPIAMPALPAAIETPRWRRLFTWSVPLGVAAAAAVILFLITRTEPGPNPYGEQRVAVKGGDLVIDLLRDTGGSPGEPDVYRDGDRFKVLITCPFADGAAVEIAVYQDGKTFEPVRAQLIECGNRVPIEGAFRLTGDTEVTVCATVGKQRGTACATIAPATQK